MKVLIAANVRWWNAEAAYAWEKAVGLRLRGHDVSFLGLPGSPFLKRAAGEGFRVFPMRGLNSLNLIGWASTIRKLRSLIIGEAIHIVDAHRSEGFALLAAAVRKSGAALIRTRGDMRRPSRDPVNRFIHVYTCHGLAASAKVVAGRMADAFNLPVEDIEVIYYGVDAVHFSPGDGESLRREWHVGPEEFLIGMVGRVDRVKGLGYFIKAAALVSRERPRARFLLAVKEDHPDMPTYRDMIEKLGLSRRMILLGCRKDIERIYRALDAVVVASIGSEANCRVTLEAMATGLPVIATRVGVIPEVLGDGRCGYLVEPGEAAPLVESLEDLIDNPLLAAEMGKDSRKRVEENFTRQKLAERVEEFYTRVRKRSGQGG